ncbi:histone H2A-beta, sperm-like [Danaus plexippus]|uniref:histone H2A-beta, sperm-like n=1 Tax=Danaus plexippus TaxID=13037 RepID=UPI002AB1D8E2|nr:histone H2A-beta, sperm-like [Danaus plexippus]
MASKSSGKNVPAPQAPASSISRKRTKTLSKSDRAGLSFPVGRIFRYLKRGRYSNRISAGSAVYLAAVLEYLCAEVLELSGDAARDHQKTRITPRHIQLAVRNDEELNQFLGGVTIANGGVLPRIHDELMAAKVKRASGEKSSKASKSGGPDETDKYDEMDNDQEDAEE